MGQRTNNGTRHTDDEWFAELDRRFRPRRNELLASRVERARAAATPAPLDHTAAIRSEEWQIAALPAGFDAALLCRPRSWSHDEPGLLVDGRPMAASLYDLGRAMLDVASGGASGPFFSLEDVQGHHEARLWNDVFCHVQDRLGVERGTIRATVVVDNEVAACEMDEILYELREHGAGLELGPTAVGGRDGIDRLVATSRRRGALSLRRAADEIPQLIPA
ncbi:MAG: hypothetical protein OES57_11130 [Acidimicrobiia bacterium]|nr:hypothetical protein [Acidimicrobiia bacterium]